MQVGEEYVVLIEKMLFGGDSLARIDGKTVFVSGGCPDDKVKIKITKVNKNFVYASIVDIIETSKYRKSPVCALHNVCGSCNWQYISYEQQLQQKENIVRETIKNITGKNYKIHEIISSPKISEYRCKVQFPVSQTKVSKRILSGYYKTGTHELINIKFCPMNKTIISEICEFIKKQAQDIGLTAYDEKTNKGLLKHFIFRQSSDEKNILVILVINDNVLSNNLKLLAERIFTEFDNVVGVCANFNTKKTNVILGNKTISIYGNDYYIDKLSDKIYKISANSFFQVNPYCAEVIFDKVKELISLKTDNPTILDAYSGVSSFGIWMSDIASKVTCIEEIVSASNDAKENIVLNHLDNVEIINGDAAIEFEKLIKNKVKFDVCIVDPPRKGCTVESIKNLVQLSKNYIVYVSCNVSTLARDMNLLAEYGYFPTHIQPADMFPNTYHIETIAFFEKQKKEAI